MAVDSRSEFPVPPAPVLLALCALGPVLYMSGEVLGRSRDLLEPLIPFTFVLSALAGASWLLLQSREAAGRWATVIALAATVWLGSGWLRIPGFVALLPLPVVLATTLISPRAGAAAALAETALALFLPHLLLLGSDATTLCVILAALWGAFAIAHGTVSPLQQVGDWLAKNCDRAQSIIEEARDRKAQLEETLQAFAHANHQLALANERTAALRAIAEEAQRSKTAFVANVSHELRTPLNIIIGLVDVMVRNPEIYSVALSPKMRKDLETVQRNCEHLSHMVSDVLDLTQTQAGRVRLRREQVSLRDVVSSSVEVVSPLLDKKQLYLRVFFPQDLPSVYCDRTRIEQVILNLVSNAARFTDEGGIEIEASRRDDQITVRVTDTGPGILPEDAKVIFEPFCQGSGHARREQGGSGLGLSISKKFVELHGGRMWLESEPGAGTSFLFTLPVSPLMDHIARPGHMIREDWIWREETVRSSAMLPVEHVRRPRVVVGDEDGVLWSQLARYTDQVEIVPVRQPAELRRSLEECPADVVLLNVSGPDSAWTLARAASEEAPGTPVVACAVPQEAHRATQTGATDYLIKPVTRSDLQHALESAGRPVRRVLVVDDNPEAIDLFDTMLRACDSTLEVASAAGGEQALVQMRAAPPDLVLLDVVMPGMDGWQVLRAMAEDEGLRNTPTFFVSAMDPTEQPAQSAFLLATISEGFSIGKLLRCSLRIAALLLEPEGSLDRAPL